MIDIAVEVRTPKAPTGIFGFDEITGGGLPRGRTTVVSGGPGSGKTVFALQSLAHGARDLKEPGIFVAFEESAARIFANAESFGWDLPTLQHKDLFFLDAQPATDIIQSGDFEFGGMLAALDAKVKAMGARRIAFDAVDVVLSLMDNPRAIRREIYRLQEWLHERDLTATITSKVFEPVWNSPAPNLDFMQFMVDCAVTLAHGVEYGVSQRNLRVVKYRGSAFAENDAPLTIGHSGLEVACARSHGDDLPPVTDERISCGVERLDTMLGGGYFRGAGILITGAPGTAKTTLAGAFSEAACARGERTLFVSFDSRDAEIVRNLASVHIGLGPFVESGLLHLNYARSISGSAESHLLRIRELARRHASRCVVVDPVSALTKVGNAETAHGVAERLIDWAKSEGITLLCTSLLDHSTPELESTPLEISTIADTWIHLNYQVNAGERNRGLSIVKSRGTSHSNQVRELVLNSSGITLSDVYTAGGEVLMGSLRFEKERAVRLKRAEDDAAAQRHLRSLDAETAKLELQMQSLKSELEHKRAEMATLARAVAAGRIESAHAREENRDSRGADTAESERSHHDG